MTAPVWSAAGLDVRPDDRFDAGAGVWVRHLGRTGAAWVGPEHARSLAWFLLAQVGDRPAPSDPDRVRVAIDDARRALRERSAAADSEDFRAGLAWCSQALDAIAAAADAAHERTPR